MVDIAIIEEFDYQLKTELKYLNRNERIDIKDIIVKYTDLKYIHVVSNGLQIEINMLSIECKREIKKYIENLYYELNEHRKQYCSKDVNTTEFKFIDF